MPGARRGCDLLPCAPAIRCDDRFDLTDMEDDRVAFWWIVQILPKRKIHDAAQLIDLLDPIAVPLRDSSLPNYDVMQVHLSSLSGNFSSDVRPAPATLALDRPILFPEGRLPVLDQMIPHIVLSRRQVACLIVQQFLCTLNAPPGRHDFYNFSIGYSSMQPHLRR